MKAVMLGCLLLATPAWAQEGPARMMLEAGIDSGNSVACPGHYVGIQGRVAGPVSGYGNADNYRCLDVAGKTTRAGISVGLGRAQWLVRPAVREGLAYDGHEVFHTIGASLTLGRRYGGRLIVDRQRVSGGAVLVLLRIGGYISF